jgi:hypothetical protein
MSEITDLTAAVKALTAQLQKGSSGPSAKAKKDAADEAIQKLREQQVLEDKLAVQRIDRAKDELTRYKEIIALQESVLSNLKQQYKLEADPAKRKAIQDSIVKQTGLLNNLKDEQKELTESTEKAKKAQKELSKELEGGKGKADQLLRKLLPLGGAMSTLATITPKSTGELIGFGQELVRNVVSGDLFAKMLLKLVSNSLEFALATDKANAAFKAATGAGNEYAGVISDAGKNFLTYGMGAEDAGRATESLFSNFRNFTNLSAAEQTTIANTTMILEKFGVSSAQTGQILDQATKSLYMNTQEAEALTRQAATLAISIGKPIKEIASDLASAGPKLAFYGKQMFDVFAQLERQSKATGLSVDSLLGLVGEKFDTFEGAGQAVGRLNAILGGPYLNSIDMLNATEADRLEMIKEAIDAGGVQFDQLNKFEQKAFASALGTDVDTLRRSLNNLDPEVQLQALRQEQLAKRAGDARDIMSKLKDAINSLVIAFEPFVTKLSESINKFSDFIQKVNQGKASINGTTIGVGKLMAGLAALAFGLKAIGFLLSPFKVLPNMLRKSTEEMANLATQTGKTASNSSRLFAGRAGMLRGGLFGLAAAGSAYATAKGVDHFRSKGQIGAAQGTAALGGAATGALTGAAIGSFIPVIGTGIGALLGGAIGLAAGTRSATQIQDGEVKMVKFSNQDTFERVGNTVVAAKPDGTLDKAIRESVEKQTAVLVEVIQNAMNVQVQVGDQQLGDVVVKALNSPRAKNSISPFYEG